MKTFIFKVIFKLSLVNKKNGDNWYLCRDIKMWSLKNVTNCSTSWSNISEAHVKWERVKCAGKKIRTKFIVMYCPRKTRRNINVACLFMHDACIIFLRNQRWFHLIYQRTHLELINLSFSSIWKDLQQKIHG